METAGLYKIIIESLRLVASLSDVQIKSLPKFVKLPDEIALTYYDAYLLVPQLNEQFSFSFESLYLLKRLDELFDKMSQDRTLWTNEKLKEDNYWQTSRELAIKALEELGEGYERPNLGFFDWLE